MTRSSAKRLIVFNHKGGVGKTTLGINIAAALGALGKRVLLVDADPQCNLTSYLLESNVVDDLLDNSDQPNGSTIWSAVKPLVEGSGDVRIVDPIEMSTPNLYLLPGDLRLSEFEAELSELWAACFQRKIRGFRGTSALSALVNSVAEKTKIDFVIYDSGPNIGPLTRVVLLDSDYFIIPAACDLFSVRALKTLGLTLAGWIREWGMIFKVAPDGLYLIPGKPKFLGYLPQRFRVYRGQVILGQAGYLSLIDKHIYSDIVTTLRELDPTLAEGTMNHFRLGQVKDFGSLAPASQTQGVPFQDVDGGHANMASQARTVFSQIAQKIVERTTPA